MHKRAYQRVLLKLSGEGFSSRPGETGISVAEVTKLAEQLKRVRDSGVELAIVVGGGNLIRGGQFSKGSDVILPATAHYMGMLGTVINGLALQSVLEHLGSETRLQTAIRMDGVAEPFIRRRCIRHLEKGRIVILACGTGNPFVTTDTAAALRALEIKAEVVFKATRVDGVFSDDPEKNPDAKLFDTLTYQQVIERKLNVMDMTAIAMCQENKTPIVVFNYTVPGNIERAVAGERVGTYVGA